MSSTVYTAIVTAIFVTAGVVHLVGWYRHPWMVHGTITNNDQRQHQHNKDVERRDRARAPYEGAAVVLLAIGTIMGLIGAKYGNGDAVSIMLISLVLIGVDKFFNPERW